MKSKHNTSVQSEVLLLGNRGMKTKERLQWNLHDIHTENLCWWSPLNSLWVVMNTCVFWRNQATVNKTANWEIPRRHSYFGAYFSHNLCNVMFYVTRSSDVRSLVVWAINQAKVTLWITKSKTNSIEDHLSRTNPARPHWADMTTTKQQKCILFSIIKISYRRRIVLVLWSLV